MGESVQTENAGGDERIRKIAIRVIAVCFIVLGVLNVIGALSGGFITDEGIDLTKLISGLVVNWTGQDLFSL
jgi:hypothetical protein